MLKSRALIRVVEVFTRRGLVNAMLLAVAYLLGALVVTTGSGNQIESALRGVRQSLMMHDASGKVAIVAIDGRSMKEVADWPWPRGIHGRMVDRLVKAGAERIAFDITFTTPASDPKQDQIFARAIERSGGRVILPGLVEDGDSSKRDTSGTMPTPVLARHATVANIYIQLDPDFVARRLMYGRRIGGAVRPSMAALLAGGRAPLAGAYPLDWSINPDSVPVYSYADVLSGKVSRELRGKKVIVGATAETLGDRYTVPNYGRVPGIFVQAIGAETLMAHHPVDVGPWPLLSAILLVLAASLLARSMAVEWASLAIVTTVTLALPFALQAWTPVQTATVPALVTCFGLLAMRAAYSVFCSILAYLTRSSSSHLPNMLAMSLEEGPAGVTVVVRMSNYVETTALLGVAPRGELMRKVHNRLEMASGGASIFQTNDNSFSWRSQRGIDEIADSIEGMYALFAPGIPIGDLKVDATIAIGLCDDPTLGLEDSVVAATLAADRAAHRGLRWERYESEREDANWRLSLLSELDEAIDGGDVWVAYQPKYDLGTRRIGGAEALVRWTHPDRGFIAPDRFIPIVEEANRIDKLTLHVLETSIRDFATMPGDLTVAVNISARLLGHGRLIGPVRAMLEKHGLPAERLTLEVTESAAMAGDGGVAELHELRALGVAISIDDYGTGQSTLSYLKRLPATELKIDRSFVQNVQTSRSDATVVDSTVKLAHALGMKVVAEGVENQEILETLAGMECDVIQGYHISRPVALADFVSLDVVQDAIGTEPARNAKAA